MMVTAAPPQPAETARAEAPSRVAPPMMAAGAVRAERRLRPVIAGCTRTLDLGGGSSAEVDRHHAEKTSEEGGAEEPSI